MGGAIKLGTDFASAAVSMQAKSDAYNANTERLRKAALAESANAVLTMQAGSIQAGQIRMKGSSIIAQQRVAFGASGVDATQGTPAGLATSSQLMSELDAQTAINNAARGALGHTQTAAQINQERIDMRKQFETGQTADAIGLSGKLIGDLTSFGSALGG